MVISRRDLMHRIGQAGSGSLALIAAATASAEAGGDGAGPAGQQFSDYPFNARQFGAKGDGSTDDTSALQHAIDKAFAAGINLYIPAGVYRTTAPLIVGRSIPANATRSGWRMFGAGPGQFAGSGGTEIRYFGEAGSAQAVLQMESSAWRTCLVEEMTLMADTARGAKYGLCFDGTGFSQHTVRRLAVLGVGTAIAILGTSGANGEFTLFEDCYFTEVDGWYYSNASQAFLPLFRHCHGALRPGGIYFNLDFGGKGAGGIEVIDCNASSAQEHGISNTLLLRNGGSDSVGLFVGGRIEHLTQLYVNQGGTPNLGMPLRIASMEIGLDFDPGNKNRSPTIGSVIDTAGNTDSALIESCRFFGDTPNVIFPIKWGGWSNLKFRNCIFELIYGPPFVISSLYNEHSSLSFEDCRAATVSGKDGYRPNAFDRNMALGETTIGKYRSYSENAWVASGRPENLLVKPQIATANGDAVMADAPWKISGAATTIGAGDWTGGPHRPRSASPFARNVIIPARTSLYQDIASLDLSADGGYGYFGTKATLVGYQAMVTALGQGAGRIALVDSVDGHIYDQYVFARGGPQTWPQLITLSAVVGRRQAPSFPRLVIANISPNETLTFEFAWQFVSSKPSPAFADSTEGPKSYSGDWGAVVENLLAFNRVALPRKADRYGSAASPPLPDLASDLYLSSTDGRLTYFSDGRWWKVPRSAPGDGPPASGAWRKGDKIENVSPEEAGTAGSRYVTVGWICIAAGSPGSWQPMRMLTGN